MNAYSTIHLSDLDRLDCNRETIVTIGKFDGVHLGHQALLKAVAARARETNRQSVAITFSPLPVQVLRPGAPVALLCDLEERIELMEAQGIELVSVLTFTQEAAHTSADDFMLMLRQRLCLRELWVGPDFALGRGRQGNVEYLSKLGESDNFQVHVFGPVTVDGEVISTSRIRALLDAGNLREANRLLGRPYQLRGTVVHGAKRGRQIGYPTANIQIPEHLAVPPDGIYAARATITNGSHHREKYMAAVSIGRRPTFDNGERTIEAYLLDFSGDLYGAILSLDFVARLRGEERFESVDALIDQIKRDVEQTRQILAE